MKKAVQLACALALGLLANGCAIAGPGFVNGGIYTGTRQGGGAGPGTSAAKTGEACAMSILGAIAVGDGSVEAAMKAGGITKVYTVDHDQFGILGIYANTCTVVKGE